MTGVDLDDHAGVDSFDQALAETLCSIAHGRAGFESMHFTVKRFRELESRLARIAPGISLESTEGLVERLRIVKDAWELEVFAEAGRDFPTPLSV